VRKQLGQASREKERAAVLLESRRKTSDVRATI